MEINFISPDIFLKLSDFLLKIKLSSSQEYSLIEYSFESFDSFIVLYLSLLKNFLLFLILTLRMILSPFLFFSHNSLCERFLELNTFL